MEATRVLAATGAYGEVTQTGVSHIKCCIMNVKVGTYSVI